MDTTWLHFGPLTIRAPVTAGTNLILACQCALYWRRLCRRRAPRPRWWSGFFLAMSFATLAGVAKHGLKHVLPASAYLAVLGATCLGSGASTFCAQRGTFARRWDHGVSAARSWLPALQLAAFTTAILALGPKMLVVVVNTALGLTPVIVKETAAARAGNRSGAYVAGGLVVSLLTAFVYLGHLSLGRWFNHIDIAHALMGVSFFLVARGASADSGGASWT